MIVDQSKVCRHVRKSMTTSPLLKPPLLRRVRAGCAFHSDGAATEKATCPISELHFKTLKLPSAAHPADVIARKFNKENWLWHRLIVSLLREWKTMEGKWNLDATSCAFGESIEVYRSGRKWILGLTFRIFHRQWQKWLVIAAVSTKFRAVKIYW